MTSPASSLLPLPSHHPELPVSGRTDALHRRLHHLPRRVQQIFLLSRLDNVPYGQIAEMLGIDCGTVEKAMQRVFAECASNEHDSAISDRAAEWYVHLQSPQATASQRIEFRHWLDHDPRHLKAFQGCERLWRELREAASLLGASNWHQRRRGSVLGWWLLAAVLCAMLATAVTVH